MLDTGFVAGIAGSAIASVVWALTPMVRCTRVGSFLRSGPASGADLAYLMALPAPSASAVYYDGRHEKAASEFARSEAGARAGVELWRHSIRWAGVTTADLTAAGFPV